MIDYEIEALNDDIVKVYKQFQLVKSYPNPNKLEYFFPRNKRLFSTARINGEIVGISAYIGCEHRLNQRILPSYQAVDSFVSPEARGNGVFTLLASKFEEFIFMENNALVWGFPNENAYQAWFNKMNWSNLGLVPLLIRPINGRQVAKKFGFDFSIPLIMRQDLNLQESDVTSKWLDIYSEGLKEQKYFGRNRTSRYLRTRLYNPSNLNQYRVVTDGHPSKPSFVASCIVNKTKMRIGYILEADGTTATAELLGSELARMRDLGVDFALAICYPWSRNYKYYKKMGFFPFPGRIRPSKVYFGGKLRQGDLSTDPRELCAYLSYMDSDTI